MKETFLITARESALMSRYGLDAAKLLQCSVRRYDFGECIIAAGAPNEYIFIVISGRAKVSLTAPNGKGMVLCFYASDGLIGEAELYSGSAADTTTVTALEDFQCIAVPVRRNTEYLNSSLAFTRSAAAEIAKKLQLTDNVVENTLYTSDVRLCRYILAAANGMYFRDIMTEVAASVGVSYRHLYRMMGALCRDGILKKTGTGYRICSMEGLAQRGSTKR